MSTRMTSTVGGTGSGPRDRCARDPTISRTSISSSSGGTASIGSARGWLAGIAPLPSVVMITGAPRRSASATRASPAPSAPPPARMAGRAACANRSAAACVSASVGLLRRRHVRQVGPLDRRRAQHRVPTDLERVRARSLVAEEREEHGVDERGHVFRTRRVLGATDDSLDRGVLVGDLVQHASPAAEVGRRHLADDAQHTAPARVGGRQPGGRVEHPRPRHHGAHADAARDPRVAVRHVARGLLVAGVDHPDRRLEREPFVEPVELHARKPEHDVDAPAPQPLDEDLVRRSARSLDVGHEVAADELPPPAASWVWRAGTRVGVGEVLDPRPVDRRRGSLRSGT